MKTHLLLFVLVCGSIGLALGIIGILSGQLQSQQQQQQEQEQELEQQQSPLVNISELDTLDRMRYTTIQMTILDLQGTNELSNITNDEIASKIFEYQQANDSVDRLTTTEVEDLYRNITEANSTL
jgi:hypothetical protein